MISQQDLEKIWNIILSGGPIMVALGILAFMLYRNILGLLVFVSRLEVYEAYSKSSADRTRASVQAFRRRLTQVIANQIKYARILIVAAPLLGLLGTVIGMLNTFKGIGAEAGQDTTKAVADGVKVALITTQTGLMIAILGLFLTQWITRIHKSKDHQLLELELETMKKGIKA